jgi:uncharacterized membrane protein YecN with MAPEG domain
MNIERVIRFRRAVQVAYSRHPVARMLRAWRGFSAAASGSPEHGIADILLLPLAGLALTLWLLGTVPGASDAVSMACSTACMP